MTMIMTMMTVIMTMMIMIMTMMTVMMTMFEFNRGALNVDSDLRHFRSSWSDVEVANAEVKNGSWRPKNCVADQRIAVVIPLRDRCLLKHSDRCLLKHGLMD